MCLCLTLINAQKRKGSVEGSGKESTRESVCAAHRGTERNDCLGAPATALSSYVCCAKLNISSSITASFTHHLIPPRNQLQYLFPSDAETLKTPWFGPLTLGCHGISGFALISPIMKTSTLSRSRHLSTPPRPILPALTPARAQNKRH